MDAVGRLAGAADARSATRSSDGLLANDIVGFHTRSYRRNFLQCCRDLLDLEVDMERGVVHSEGPRGVGARVPAADRLRGDARGGRGGAGVAEFEERLLRRRREYSILRVDRADLSKNVLRGFTAFDIFLEQHPEFAERITFTAQLMPSRTDVPEYAEYLEQIEALVAVVNHRHGTPDWMPIDLKLRDDLEEAVASYKHYDVMMVNAMFDGMNLVAKEGPLVNERDGVSILSREHGRARGARRVRAVGQPVRRAGAGRRDLLGADDVAGERARRAAGLKEIVTSRDPGDWIDEQIADIRAKARGAPASVVEPVSRALEPELGLRRVGPRRCAWSTGAARRRRAPAQAWSCAARRSRTCRLGAPRARLPGAAGGRVSARRAGAASPQPAARRTRSGARPRRRRRRPAASARSGAPRPRGGAEARPRHHGATSTTRPAARDVPPAHPAQQRDAHAMPRARPAVRPALLACAAAWPPKPLSTT